MEFPKAGLRSTTQITVGARGSRLRVLYRQQEAQRSHRNRGGLPQAGLRSNPASPLRAQARTMLLQSRRSCEARMHGREINAQPPIYIQRLKVPRRQWQVRQTVWAAALQRSRRVAHPNRQYKRCAPLTRKRVGETGLTVRMAKALCQSRCLCQPVRLSPTPARGSDLRPPQPLTLASTEAQLHISPAAQKGTLFLRENGDAVWRLRGRKGERVPVRKQLLCAEAGASAVRRASIQALGTHRIRLPSRPHLSVLHCSRPKDQVVLRRALGA
jgi:hypothetical protein